MPGSPLSLPRNGFNPLWLKSTECDMTRMVKESILDIFSLVPGPSVLDILIMKSVTAYLSHYIKWWQRFLSLQQIMEYNTYNYNLPIKNDITTLKGNIKWLGKKNTIELDKSESNLKFFTWQFTWRPGFIF